MSELLSVTDIRQVWEKMVPDSDQRAAAEAVMRVIVLSQGELEDGSFYYAYLAVSPENYMRLLETEMREETGYRLSDFGDVLCQGEGEEPSEEVRHMMAEKYAADKNLAADFDELINLTLGCMQAVEKNLLVSSSLDNQ